MRAALETTLAQFGHTDLGPQLLQRVAVKEPDLFFASAMDILREESAPDQGKRQMRLLDVPAFLRQLASPQRLSREELLEFCQRLVEKDPLLDVKLARLLPGRQPHPQDLDGAAVVRLMDVLDAISPGPRLMMIIGHLAQHADPRIASKSSLLIGRRLHNPAWVGTQMASWDARVRANVVEALWGERTALALKTFRRCLLDQNNRVVGNALVGLYLAQEIDLGPRIEHLSHDPRPAFRQTAVWVMEKTRDPRFTPWLEAAATDVDPAVRDAAQRALHSLAASPSQPA